MNLGRVQKQEIIIALRLITLSSRTNYQDFDKTTAIDHIESDFNQPWVKVTY